MTLRLGRPLRVARPYDAQRTVNSITWKTSLAHFIRPSSTQIASKQVNASPFEHFVALKNVCLWWLLIKFVTFELWRVDLTL